ncbi:hypothetical protein CHS0354_016370 [Potamilus streckersoni]|uniref:Ankyrin repeat protein n=1 Tax=Potamilus streckersoni TaxID=2493646 RepID=A0AAE0SW19_9BIVA|nr:hypothetical protein CHS0354_016370 [Potamilus streckersoni]
MQHKYDVCDLLFQEGFSLTMKNFLDMVSSVSFDYIKKTIQDMKETNNWNPKCDDASKALETAYCLHKYDVYGLLVQEGVSFTMHNLPHVVERVSYDNILKTVQNIKDNGYWDPKCDDASKALENAYSRQMYDVCDLLDQEGVSLTMNNLPCVVERVSFKKISLTIQNMKDNNNWDPGCDHACEALENALSQDMYDVCDLLFQEGVSLTMENLPQVVDSGSFEYIRKAVQNMKESDNWDPKCDDASEAFDNAYIYERYDVCDLLVQEGVLQTK